MAYTFHKQERLCSRKKIEQLFKTGKTFIAYPLKAVFLFYEASDSFPAKVMFVVPKRQFRRANARNLLKRRTREAYRLAKSEFYTELKQEGRVCALALLYVSKREESYQDIEKAVKKLTRKISAYSLP